MYKKLISYLFREKINSMASKPAQGSHWCRVVMDNETEQLVSKLPYQNFSALEISGDKWKNFGFSEYTSASYPEYDVCVGKLDKQFDIVIAEQVFEHLLWPYRAAKNVYEMIKPNGYFLISTPFLIKIHDYPQDCSRWTETGIKYFLAEAGFNLENISTGSWGNIECVVSNFNQWTVYKNGFHNLENDPNLPIVVWALAKKV
jgi:SAM-dependent methyltransferase